MLPGHALFLIATSACGLDPLDLGVELVGVLRPQRLRVDEHVVAALAERREEQVYDVEPVVEILPEAPRADLLFEHPVGRRHDPDVDLLRLRVADPEDHPLLQRAEELHLEV